MSKFNVGDEVRLTGTLWRGAMPQRGTIHIIDEVDANGAAYFRTQGHRWRISEPGVKWGLIPAEHYSAELVSHGETDTPAMAAARIRDEVQTIKLPVPEPEPGAIKTPEQVAADEIYAAVENMTPDEAAEFLRDSATMATHWMVAAIEADRAQAKELLEREASILDGYRRDLDGKVDYALIHNMGRASEAMRIVAGWDHVEAFRKSHS